MFLKEILKIIEEKGTVIPEDIAKESDYTLEQIKYAIDFWGKKGKLNQFSITKNINSCKNCSCGNKKSCG